MIIKTYYIKTHSNGWYKMENSSGATTIASAIPQSVNAHELLAYKVLKNLGLGPESHFFGRNEKCIFIATEDVNETKTFKQYSEFKDSYDILKYKDPI